MRLSLYAAYTREKNDATLRDEFTKIFRKLQINSPWKPHIAKFENLQKKKKNRGIILIIAYADDTKYAYRKDFSSNEILTQRKFI